MRRIAVTIASALSTISVAQGHPIYDLGRRICLCALLIAVGATAEAEPAGAQVTYYGGPIVANVKSYIILWGGSPGDYLSQVVASTPNIGTFLTDGFAPTFDWLSEYSTTGVTPANGGGGSNQTLGRGTFAGHFTIVPSAANNGSTVDDSQIQAELDAQIVAGHLPEPDSNTVYIVYFPHGTTITMGGSTSCVSSGFCAYHSARVSTAFSSNGGRYLYAVMPDMQAGSGCDTGCGNASTPFSNYTSVLTHVLGGIVTDPEASLATGLAPPVAWYDSNNGEIGAICSGQEALITGSDNQTYTVQRLWSNFSGACIALVANAFALAANPSTITIAPGGNANSTITTAARRGSSTQSIELSASGLPAGVSASFSANPITSGGSSTLTLSSTAAVAPGTSSVTVTGTELGTTDSHNALVTLIVITDTIPPTTTATQNPGPDGNGWNNMSVTVGLSAVDNPSGSGVKQISYTLSGAQAGGAVVAGNSTSVTISAEGVTTLSYFATDNAGNQEAQKFTSPPVSIDKTPPTITCSVTPNVLWPSNHKLVSVKASVTVMDTLSGSAGFTLVSVTSNEPDAGTGPEDQPNDIQGFVVGTPSTIGQLRAESALTGTGRIYTLTFQGMDVAGNAALCRTTVSVPQNQKQKQ